MAEIDDLSAELDALEDRLGRSAEMTTAFSGELERLQQTTAFTGREIGSLSTGFSGGLKRAFDGLILDGGRLSDALKGVGKAISDTIYSATMRPVSQALGGALAESLGGIMSGALPFAKGGAFVEGRVMPFADGGIVTAPTTFPMRGGRGLMGEAGPEAIMPLSRGADGRLGVRAAGEARPVSVVMNISTPDVDGFRRSQSQIAAQITRALGRGQRNQ